MQYFQKEGFHPAACILYFILNLTIIIQGLFNQLRLKLLFINNKLNYSTYSYPMVGGEEALNESETNRWTKHDFPTPASYDKNTDK